jgi:hypothetical protein
MAKWSVPLEKLAKKANVSMDVIVRKSTFDIFSRVVRASPVDTGRFKSNWNVSFGAPDRSTTASTATMRSEGEIRKALTLPVGGVVYLTNSLPYAVRLEYGYSKTQAPQGMVRIAAREWVAKVREAARKA